MTGSSTRLALADTWMDRPVVLGGRTEITVAGMAPRSFPAHVSSTMGICFKVGGDHAVVSDGRRLVYPENTICLRPPGCLWSSGPGVHGFVSLDLTADLLAGLQPGSEMIFVDRRRLTSIPDLARSLLTLESTLRAEELVGELLAELVDIGWAAGPGQHLVGRTTVAVAQDFLTSHLADRPTLDETAAAAGVDKYALLRAFRRTLNTTPHAYLVMVRTTRAQSRLAAGVSLSEAAAECGFADQAHLGRWFRRIHGITPAAYQRQVRRAISL